MNFKKIYHCIKKKFLTIIDRMVYKILAFVREKLEILSPFVEKMVRVVPFSIQLRN